jgi:hypothetical protein
VTVVGLLTLVGLGLAFWWFRLRQHEKTTKISAATKEYEKAEMDGREMPPRELDGNNQIYELDERLG